MKYTIAICDDEPVQVRVIEKYMESFNKEKKFHIICSNSGEQLLSQIQYKPAHICFLDIQMKGMNGLEIGKKIRELNKNAIIIFITGFKDYALHAFGIKAFDYIIKPITEERFKNLFQEISEKLKITYRYAEEEKDLTIKTKEGIYNIKYDSIYYFEKHLRKIVAVCKGKNLEFNESFKNLKDHLDMTCFTQCHQGFIVNNKKISFYKNQQICVEKINLYIPVSRACVNEVRRISCHNLFR
ncbi:LytTR family DNA-binding domain-containing protein [Clostridium estertheticum]|uniref:LytR/AlgR family response regulator transcription factor n=1 Tax=Clostridium estertheticum TaxID=238834 RepID=UPI0013EEB3DD|nr:LytTR family DNA-binding domain-containing protein [Clostridium estertheticum]MBZ9607261.1 LytTR family DNA-binding domain-containing protein [Clostridium estertheticum]